MIILKRSWDWEGKDTSKSFKQMRMILFAHTWNGSVVLSSVGGVGAASC